MLNGFIPPLWLCIIIYGSNKQIDAEPSDIDDDGADGPKQASVRRRRLRDSFASDHEKAFEGT